MSLVNKIQPAQNWLDFLYVPCGTSSCLPERGMAGSVSPGETHYIYKEKFIKR